VDKSRGTAKPAGFGGSIFGGTPSIPPELRDLVTPQQNVSKQLLPLKSSLSTANAEYDKLTDPASPVPAAPVFAARLNGLLKHLATAEGAVAESIETRKVLVAAIEKVLDSNRKALEADQEQQRTLASRKEAIEKKKQEVELSIMRNLTGNEDAEVPGERPSGSPAPEPDRPEMEALTPPHMEDSHDFYSNSPGPQNGNLQSPTHVQSPTHYHSPAPGIEMLSNLASQYPAVPVTANGSNKRRRLDSGEDIPGLDGDDGIDADVAEMLRRDSRSS
jgi:regulator of Ty1 transposition protein 103